MPSFVLLNQNTTYIYTKGKRILIEYFDFSEEQLNSMVADFHTAFSAPHSHGLNIQSAHLKDLMYSL